MSNPQAQREAHRRRDADATVPVRTTFLRQGQASPVHEHGQGSLWTHVISGELVEDRWRPRSGGGFVHERRALRTGQALAAPGDAFHCVRARRDTVFVTTCACGCVGAKAIEPARVAEMRRRAPMELEVASTTVAGEPAPSSADTALNRHRAEQTPR